jgi:hypothetical protein
MLLESLVSLVSWQRHVQAKLDLLHLGPRQLPNADKDGSTDLGEHSVAGALRAALPCSLGRIMVLVASLAQRPSVQLMRFDRLCSVMQRKSINACLDPAMLWVPRRASDWELDFLSTLRCLLKLHVPLTRLGEVRQLNNARQVCQVS